MPELEPKPIYLPEGLGPLYSYDGTPRAATVLADPSSLEPKPEPTLDNARAILDAYYLAANNPNRATTWSPRGEDRRVPDSRVRLGASRRGVTRRLGIEFTDSINKLGDMHNPERRSQARYIDRLSKEWMPLFLEVANEDMVLPIDIEDATADADQAATEAQYYSSKDFPENERVAEFYRQRFGDFVSLDQMIVSEHPELAGVALAGLLNLFKAAGPSSIPDNSDEKILFFDKAANKVTRRRGRLFDNDPLTDIPQRDSGDTIAADLMELAKKQGNDLAVIYLDCNRFKSFQDEWLSSHAAGDQLLKDVARTLKELIRPWRQGGDEFAGIMLPYDQPNNPVDGKTITPAGVADFMDMFNKRLEQNISKSIAKKGYSNEQVEINNLSDFDKFVRTNIFNDVEGVDDMSLGQLMVSAGARIVRPVEMHETVSSVISDADHQVFLYKKRKFGSRDKPRDRSNDGLAIEELRNVVVAYAA